MKLAVAVLLVLAWGRMLAGAGPGGAPRTAVLDFTLAHAPGNLDPVAVDFSRAVQARIWENGDYAWVERQEFERLAWEADIGSISGAEASAAVRLGHLLQADLLLRGEIASRPAGGAELTIEAIDLKRAEVLATRAVPVTLNSRQRFHPTAPEVAAAAAAGLEVLGEARGRLDQFQKLRVLAPLHFRNTSKSDRLDFLEARLKAALDKVAVPVTGFRTLRFPRAGEAGEEASLVLAGLTDTNPEAWRQVADAYVWGEFHEEGEEGVAFAEVPVAMVVQIWTGAGEPREVRGRGTVKTLDADLEALAGRVLAEVAAGPRDAASDRAERRLVAKALHQRAEEVARQLGNNPAVRESRTGRQLYALRVRLLEIACFFDPLDRSLQEQRLQVTWAPENPAGWLETLRGHWLRVTDYRLQAARFPRLADGSLDGQWPTVRERHLREFVALLRKASWRTKEIRVSGEEVHRQLGAIVDQWSRLLVATHAAVQGDARAASWYPRLRTEWFERATFLQDISDPLIFHDAWEMTWRIWEPELGRLLKDPDRKQDAERWIETLFSNYGVLGDHERPTAILDSAWQQGVAAPVASAPPPAVRPLPPREEQPWAVRPAPPRPRQAPAGGAPNYPVLPAEIREFDPRSVRRYSRGRSLEEPFLWKNTDATAKVLAWQAGKLWIFEENEELREGFGAGNPQGNHFLWSYDPALRQAELISANLGPHAAVNAVLPVESSLWLGFAAEGVWRWDGAREVRRFTGEDGLQSMQTTHAVSDGKELFFLGGTVAQPLISRYSLKEGSWSGLEVPQPKPMPPWLLNLPPGASLQQPYQLAVNDDWLCFSGVWAACYDRRTRQWVDLGLGTGFGGFSAVSADEQGLWLIKGTEDDSYAVQMHPARPKQARVVRLPAGIPRAVAHEGHRMWILMVGLGGSRLVLVDKSAMTCTGQIVLPMPDGCSLAVGGGRAWVGGRRAANEAGTWTGDLRMVEVDLRAAGLAGPAGPVAASDYPVNRAVWQGDKAALADALAGKADANACAASGWTALMGAAAAGRGDMVTLLLEAGADPNRISRDGETALQLAVARGDGESVQQLLRHGAQPNLRARAKLVRSAPPLGPDLPATGAAPVSRPVAPANVKAAATPDGEVALTWEDRADNESSYEICYKNSYGMRMLVARLPANSTSWIDPTARSDAELVYTVEAINELSRAARDSRAVAASIVRPALAENVVRSEYGFYEDWLPARHLALLPLAVAAKTGRLDLVGLLLSAGADVNQTDAAGYTALMHAVRDRQYQAARLLLKQGARTDAISVLEESAVGLAYRWHEDEALFVDLLRALPADSRSAETTMLLGQAAARGDLADIRRMFEGGADLGERTMSGDTPLRMALAADQLETAQWLLDQVTATLEPRLRTGKLRDADQAMVEMAVKNNRPEFFSRLLDRGLGVDQLVNGQPLAAFAAKEKAFAVLVLLRDRGANLEQRGSVINIDSTADGSALGYLTAEEVRLHLGTTKATSRETWALPSYQTMRSPGPTQYVWEPDPAKLELNAALIAAAQRGDLPAVMDAVAAGAQLDCFGKEVRTPLLEALKAKAFAVVRWLVEEGASVNCPSAKGFSPVAFAAGAGKAEELDYLLQAGADPNLFGSSGMPPLTYVVQQGDLGIARQLLAAGANPNVSAAWRARRESALAVALAKGNEAAVDLLLAAGANPRGQTYEFVSGAGGGIIRNPEPSLLMHAAAGGKLSLVKRMIEFGQDPKLQTGDGHDALSWAASIGSREIVEFLLPLSQPRGRALRMAESKGHTEIVEFLSKSGYR